MSAAALLARLDRVGVRVTLEADGQTLSLSAQAEPPADLLAEVKAHKLELLAHLARTCATCRHLNREAARRDGWPEGMGVCALGWAAHGEPDVHHPGVPKPVMSVGAHCMAQDGRAWQVKP